MTSIRTTLCLNYAFIRIDNFICRKNYHYDVRIEYEKLGAMYTIDTAFIEDVGDANRVWDKKTYINLVYELMNDPQNTLQ